MKNTNIEWTNHTVNFWWGCTKVSPACAHCYAESVAKVFGKRIFGAVPQWGAGKPRAERLEAARKEALALDRKAEKDGTRPRVFVNSMSDWLDNEVPIEWLAYLLETIHLCPHLDFQLLTKRPQNWGVRTLAACLHMAGYRDGQISGAGPTAEEMQGGQMVWDWGKEGSPPSNVWIGTTVENQEMAEQRIPALLEIPAKVRFLSCEPLLGPVNLRCLRNMPGHDEDAKLDALTGYEWTSPRDDGEPEPEASRIHWVIAGGESGGKARPSHPDWFRGLRDQCAAARVPFFFKQWGEWAPKSAKCDVQDDRWEDSLFGEFHSGSDWVDGCCCSEGDELIYRLGKDHAGRKLDGIEHSAFPG